MGKKPSAAQKSRKKASASAKQASASGSSTPKPSPMPSESASAAVERIFGAAKNRFVSQLQNPSFASSSREASKTPAAQDSSDEDDDEDDSEEEDGAEDGGSVNLSDVDGQHISPAGLAAEAEGAASDSETDSEGVLQQKKGNKPPKRPATSAKGKGKENASVEKTVDSNTSGDATGKPTRFGEIVFVPVVPVVPPGDRLPMLPLPTPHEINSLRSAGLVAEPGNGTRTFALDSQSSHRDVNRFFRHQLPVPFTAIGKKAEYHLLFGHGNTLGGCGNPKPTALNIANAYRAGKAANQKVLFLAPAEAIDDKVIEAWSLSAIVKAITRRLDNTQKKRKRQITRQDSSSENDYINGQDQTDEDSSEDDSDDAEVAEPADALVVSAGAPSDPVSENDSHSEKQGPPRKRMRMDSPSESPTPSKIRSYGNLGSSSGASYSTRAALARRRGPRVLRALNSSTSRSQSASESRKASAPTNPLNIWLNSTTYKLE
ncbi:hypothetical protein M407DRAFT_29237 [Tulasnella calospora MUT 4182]|uniref:Uncharacterized protein n=1 Tax=Tulasnella calospora MUT 4182 TaxID=1051891 RepID=A0A0C3QAF6_9AGAM|nr:hypothetical protein M407DRAFT_29237 [Tulasnella calospora MUT 4182]